ncbi:hypothetical protein VTK73DRAFT_218 [Phialemonium thermophilum]|uniref:Uncharacterized protein n=1 Tax=Phialemonium thermophilum TaxID=223376 RepID=A0ABR3VW95_9PEZI
MAGARSCPRPVLVAALLAALLAGQGLVAAGDSAPVDPRPPSNQADGLAYQPIEGLETYATNLTKDIENMPGGWYDPKICVRGYCVFSNPLLNHGRGLVAVTNHDNLERIRHVVPGMEQ